MWIMCVCVFLYGSEVGIFLLTFVLKTKLVCFFSLPSTPEASRVIPGTPNSWDSLIVSFPYYFHIFGDSCGSGMGLVWPSHPPLFGHSRCGRSEAWGSDHLDSMSGNLHNPRVATGKLVALGNQKRWVEAIQLLGVHHWEKAGGTWGWIWG